MNHQLNILEPLVGGGYLSGVQSTGYGPAGRHKPPSPLYLEVDGRSTPVSPPPMDGGGWAVPRPVWLFGGDCKLGKKAGPLPGTYSGR